MDIGLRSLAKEIPVTLIFVSLCLLIFLRVGLKDPLLDVSISCLAVAFLFEVVRGNKYLYILILFFWMVLLPTYGVDYFNQKYRFDDSASVIKFPEGMIVHDDSRFVYLDSAGKCHSKFQISDYQCKKLVKEMVEN